MSLPVVTTPVSDDHIQAIDAWWRENRAAAAGLFAEELAACVELLGRMPRVGRRYRHPHVSGLRRVLLRASRHHVYTPSTKHRSSFMPSGMRSAAPIRNWVMDSPLDEHRVR